MVVMVLIPPVLDLTRLLVDIIDCVYTTSKLSDVTKGIACMSRPNKERERKRKKFKFK